MFWKNERKTECFMREIIVISDLKNYFRQTKIIFEIK